MSTTILAQDLISACLQDLGRIAPGETPSVNASNAAFLLLNEILSSWSRDGRINYTEKVGTAALTASVDSYTIGVGGTFNTTAYPQNVKGARCSYNGFQQGCHVVPMAEFETLTNAQLGESASLISLIGVDNAAPLRNARVFPMPNAAATVEYSWWEPLTLISTLSSAVTFPVEGWEAALRSELTVALAPSYGLEATTTIAANMQRFRARIADTGTSNPPQPQAPQQAPPGPPQP